MCSAHCLMVLYICEKFIIISHLLFNLQSGQKCRVVEMAIFNVQRAITPKVGIPDLQLMSYANRHIKLYICVKFCENIERTWVHSRNGSFQYLLCSKGCNSKSRITKVTFFVFCTLSHGALYLCEVSRKYLGWYQSYGAATNEEALTNRWTFKISEGIT